MLILAAADIHGQWPVYEWLLATAREERVEAILLAGDLLSGAEGFDSVEESQRHEAGALAALLDSAGLPVIYLMGNDDLVELNATSDRVHSVHGKRVQLGRFSFAGYQYSLPWMGGVFEKPEDGIEADLAGLAPSVDADTIVVSHSPAFGILDGPNTIGSRALLRFLHTNSFRAHIHGHCHSGFGRYENHFNVAAGWHRRAMIIDLEPWHTGSSANNPDSGISTRTTWCLSPYMPPDMNRGRTARTDRGLWRRTRPTAF